MQLKAVSRRVPFLLGVFLLTSAGLVASAGSATAAPGSNGNGAAHSQAAPKVSKNVKATAASPTVGATMAPTTSKVAPATAAPTQSAHTPGMGANSVASCENGGHTGSACQNPQPTGCNSNNPNGGGCPASGPTGPVCGNGLHVGNPHCIVRATTPNPPPVVTPAPPLVVPGSPRVVSPDGPAPAVTPSAVLATPSVAADVVRIALAPATALARVESAATLPFTGSNSAPLVLFALGMVGVGLLAVVVSVTRSSAVQPGSE